MSLPEFVTPVLGIAGAAALVFVIMRCFPHIARRHAARREGENATWRSSPGSTATPVTLRQS